VFWTSTRAGAHASALIYSLLETAKANGHKPYLWLRHILSSLPSDKNIEHCERLLPWNLDPARFDPKSKLLNTLAFMDRF
jgi:hypothetical protein